MEGVTLGRERERKIVHFCYGKHFVTAQVLCSSPCLSRTISMLSSSYSFFTCFLFSFFVLLIPPFHSRPICFKHFHFLGVLFSYQLNFFSLTSFPLLPSSLSLLTVTVAHLSSFSFFCVHLHHHASSSLPSLVCVSLSHFHFSPHFRFQPHSTLPTVFTFLSLSLCTWLSLLPRSLPPRNLPSSFFLLASTLNPSTSTFTHESNMRSYDTQVLFMFILLCVFFFSLLCSI